MFSDAYLFLSGFFSQIWKCFTGFLVPGTEATPAHFWLGKLFVIMMLYSMFRILHHRYSPDANGDSKTE